MSIALHANRIQPVRIAARKASAHAQRGVVLIVALVVLVAMSLGGIAILRSVDTATLIAGNIAFKQRTLQSSDIGVETAIQWLSNNISSLSNDNLGQAYRSSAATTSDQRFAWEQATSWASNVRTLTPDAAGNTVQYVIHRMCTLPGVDRNAAGQQCATSSTQGTTNLASSAEGGSFVGGSSAYTSPPQTYMRIIVRTTGPRNAVSYVQAMVLISI